MNETHFPALYIAANQASNTAQRHLLNLHRSSSATLILAAALAPFADKSANLAILNALLFFVSLCLFILGQQQSFQEKWYKARALAESIKTAVWRLVMEARPFTDNSEAARLKRFQALLNELLSENKSIGEYLSGDKAQAQQITPEMMELLRSSYTHKREVYLTDRIADQREWYARKSGLNRTSSSRWRAFLYSVYAVAITLLLIKVGSPQASLPPVDVFAVTASSIIGWMQIKRYDELASAYGLTAHEIGIIESCFRSVRSQDQLSDFVADAENAFSREHTQWAARRDQ